MGCSWIAIELLTGRVVRGLLSVEKSLVLLLVAVGFVCIVVIVYALLIN